MLSIEESVWFISQVLKLTYNKESRQQDPIGFLNYLIQGFHQNIPFQSVTLLSKPLISRGKPTWEEIKTEVMYAKHIYEISFGIFRILCLSFIMHNTQ